MAFFSPENSIEQGPSQRSRPQRDEADQERTFTVNASIKFGNKPKQSRPEQDEVAKQHSFYTAEKRSTRVYYSDYQQKTEVMRATASKVSTKLDDRQTVGAMLDLVQSRGWDTVKLKGSEDFKREAWVQAQVRGLETEGYSPKATDKQEAERRKEAAAPVEAKLPPRPTPAVRQSSKQADAKPEIQTAQAVWGEVEKQGQRARSGAATQQAQASRPRASEAA